jgi:hypothetical protein
MGILMMLEHCVWILVLAVCLVLAMVRLSGGRNGTTVPLE